ncbi:MAG: hypothetical protein ACJAV5_000914 [Vicingaceae bacterium]|jgi:hypothetical protein
MVQQITIIDIIISLFYIIVILSIVSIFKPAKEKNYAKLYFPFVISKIIFAIIFVLIHSYYYKGGDTFLYFAGGNFFYEQIKANPIALLKILNSSFGSLNDLSYTSSYGIISSIRSNDVFFMSKILGIILLFTGKNFLAANIIFTSLTAIGIWKLYTTMCKLYPRLYKLFALGILFYPSLGIWGSGILKDPLTFAAVGVIFSSTYHLINRKKVFYSVMGIIISTLLCFVLKPYILYTFIPIILLWAQGQISRKVKNPFFKIIITPLIITIFCIGGYFALNSVSSGAGKYSLDSVQSVAEGFQSWHTYLAETRDQSGYSLGEVEFTPIGILTKAPQAFFVTYFRPFIIGDVRNIATLFEAIQALILLILSIYVFLRVGILKSLRLIVSNTDLRAFMLFAIIFGVTVGLTSYNFGALSRYKIPSVPFYVASISIIYYLGYLKPKKGFA